jgi:hypothetical protein
MRRVSRAALFLAVVLAVCVSSKPAGATTRLGCHVNVWIHGQTYTGTVIRSWRTSCPFAKRVTAKSLTFIVNHGGQGDGDFYVSVYSPVTFKWYQMHCQANGDLRASFGMNVTCRGGIGALVHYVAHAR